MPTIFEAFVKLDFCLIILISSKLILLISSELILLISSDLTHHHFSSTSAISQSGPFPEWQDLDFRFIHVTRKCWTSPNIKTFVSPSSLLSSLHLAWIICPLGLLFYRPFTMSFCPCHSALSYTRRDLWNHLHNEGRMKTGRGWGWGWEVGCQFWGRIARTSISTWF